MEISRPKVDNLGGELALKILPDVPIPIESKDFDRSQLEKFINLHPSDKLRELLSRLLAEINYVSFTEFTNALATQIEYINSHFTDRDFVIVNTDTERGKSPKSDHWATAIAKPNLKVKPNAVVMVSKLGEHLSQNPDTKNIVIFDDCCYSGEQIRQLINGIWREKPEKTKALNTYVAVPYMTHDSEKTIQETGRRTGIKTTLIQHRNIPNIEEIMSKLFKGAGLEKNKKLLDLVWDTGERVTVLSNTLTYFQHKVPDHISFPAYLREGNVVDYDSKETRRWYTGVAVPSIPSITPPYKKGPE